jgi:ribonuclease G
MRIIFTMGKLTLYFDDQCGCAIYAMEENGKLVEFNQENGARENIVGNIYKGKVTNVLNGMQAAFINCGLERNCYISVDDLFPDKSKYDGKEIDIPAVLDLKIGDEILVQVTKAPVGKKGARVTTGISFVGKYCIYMPKTPFVGVSRKIEDEELRNTLIADAERELTGTEGLIVRTASPYADLKDKIAELNYFRRVYAQILKDFDASPAGTLLYSEIPLHVRVLRDLMVRDIEKIYTGTKELYASVKRIFDFSPEEHDVEIILHDDGTDMLHHINKSEELLKIIDPKVELDNGAYLVIEKTEALTVIDVNTGKFVGDDSLEHTVYYTNILAAREIARQVRLRNIGGIIVVDFIDMEDESHQAAVVAELAEALKSDKANCKIAPMSQFGLVEFTRKRIGTSPLKNMTKPCACCKGTGFIRTDEYVIFDLRARLMEMLAEGCDKIHIDMSVNLLDEFKGNVLYYKEIKRIYPQAEIYLAPHRHYHDDTFNLKAIEPDEASADGTVLLY